MVGCLFEPNSGLYFQTCPTTVIWELKSKRKVSLYALLKNDLEKFVSFYRLI